LCRPFLELGGVEHQIEERLHRRIGLTRRLAGLGRIAGKASKSIGRIRDRICVGIVECAQRRARQSEGNQQDSGGQGVTHQHSPSLFQNFQAERKSVTGPPGAVMMPFTNPLNRAMAIPAAGLCSDVVAAAGNARLQGGLRMHGSRCWMCARRSYRSSTTRCLFTVSGMLLYWSSVI
jgi:hypothetical protein